MNKFRDILHAAGETLKLTKESEKEYNEKPEGSKNKADNVKSFSCNYCGTKYANFYYKAAKEHDINRGGSCPLQLAHQKGIKVPSKNHVTSLGLLFFCEEKDIEIIDID